MRPSSVRALTLLFIGFSALQVRATEPAAELLDECLAAHGGMAPLESAGGIRMRSEGTFDLSVRHQGRSPERPEPTPIVEQLSVDLREDRMAFDLDWWNYVHSNQHMREIYDANNRVLMFDRVNGLAFWQSHLVVEDQKARHLRALAPFLLREARQSESLRARGAQVVDGRVFETVSFVTSAGDELVLYIDAWTRLLAGAQTTIDMPLLADTRVSWWWSDHAPFAERLMLPRTIEMQLDGAVLKRVSTSYRLGVQEDLFRAPDGIEPPPAPEPTPFEPQSGHAAQTSAVDTLAPGTYVARNLRPGFHVLFVEFEDFVVAVDAPSGWFEMQYLPPMNWAGGDASGALGGKLLRTIRATLPDKPVRYLVATHHHTDHIGGFRAFVRARSTIVGGRTTVDVLRRALARPATLAADDVSAETAGGAKFEVVDGRYVIEDGHRRLVLLELPEDNPQAVDFLVVHLPEEKILYTTALFYPVPERVFPLEASIPSMTWFVNWLDASGLEVETLYTVHGMGRVEPWQIEAARKIAAGS